VKVEMKVVAIKHISKPAETMLDLARALADYMIGDGRDLETLPWEEVVTNTLKELVAARTEERRLCAHLF